MSIPDDTPTQKGRRAGDVDSSGRPVSLTEDQLEYMSEQTARAVSSAVKRYVRGALIGFTILAAGIGFSLWASNQDSTAAREQIVLSGRAVAVDGCNRDFVDRQIARVQTERALAIIDREFKQGNSTDREHALAVDFYTKQLESQVLPDCRQARSLLTDDPNAKIVVPVPRYPGDRRAKP